MPSKPMKQISMCLIFVCVVSMASMRIDKLIRDYISSKQKKGIFINIVCKYYTFTLVQSIHIDNSVETSEYTIAMKYFVSTSRPVCANKTIHMWSSTL